MSDRSAPALLTLAPAYGTRQNEGLGVWHVARPSLRSAEGNTYFRLDIEIEFTSETIPRHQI